MALVSFGTAALLGVAHLHYPFMGDQALFSVFGRMLDGGAVLYEDVWDVKQPGIFAFYLTAGRLFGFTEVGAHALELIYFLLFSLIAMYLLRERYSRQWIAALLPLALVAWYYAAARPNYLTQVEALVGPLLFGSVWLALRGGRYRYVLAGALGGLVLFFKLALAPLVAALWITAIVTRGSAGRQLRQALPWLSAGLAVIAIPWLIYIASQGLFDRVWWTYVTYPPQVPAIAGRTLRRLVLSVGQFGVLYLPLFFLGLHGAWAKRRDPLTQISIAWIVGGFATFLFQLWWGYLLLVMIVPLALLALDGLDSLLVNKPRHWRSHLAIATVALLPISVAVGIKGLDLATNGFGIGSSLTEYQEAVSPDYADIRHDIAALPLTVASPAYVLGDPLYLFLGELDQVPANTGWSPEFWTDELWDELETGLTEHAPAIVFVNQFNLDLAAERSPDTIELIDHLYTELAASSRGGTWYVLRDNPSS